MAGAAVAALVTALLAVAGPSAGATGAPGRDCGVPDRPFTPTAMTFPGVAGTRTVLALGRDPHGVPRTPPLTAKGKWQLGWDKESRIRPGSRQGVVRMTAHTYPRDGRYGLALGNRLLKRLHRGDLVVAKGRDGARLCYRVTRELRVRAERRLPAYYATAGRPRLAILVCSGTRRGPGDWSHRTIWFAEPVDGV